MTVTVANLPYSFCPTGKAQSNQGFMFKNAYDAWFYNNSTATATQITDIDYPGYHTYSATLTSASTTATATVAAGHGLQVGDSVTIAGATPNEYNGTYTVVTVPLSTTFTYTFAGSGTSPATGTITAIGGRVTVPGIVFIDGYFAVMDTNATIRTSNLNDATAWTALDFITAQIEPGLGVALGKTNDYAIAFKEWSTEFFYDAGNPVGSPLSPVQNGFNLIGCASGDSLANLDGVLFWVSQTRQKGRGVYMMQGLQTQQISTPDIERILNLSTLATVYSYGVKIAGHAFYVLTLVDQNITLVYDATSKMWAQWSSLTAGSPVSVTTITLSGTTATVTATAHGVTDGDPVLIAGAVQALFNGIKVATYVSSSVFTFEIPTAANVSVTTLTRSGTTATATTTAAHGLTSGQIYTIAGATQSDYNGDFTVTSTGTYTFTYTVANNPTTPATGTILVYNPVLTATGTITATPYTETYFKYVKYINALSKDLVQHETNGTLCELTESAYQDVACPVNVLIRTGKFDGGTTVLKQFAAFELIGNKVSSLAYVRHSGDDYTTYTKYRPVDLSIKRSRINRLGADERRSFDIRHTANTALHLSAADIDVK